MITAREEERRQLRRDLHDGLGPVLTGVVLNAEAAFVAWIHDPARTADLLVELRDQATGALEDIRRLVYDLRPPALDSLGLVEALREQAVLGSVRMMHRCGSASRRRHRCPNCRPPWRWPRTGSSPRR